MKTAIAVIFSATQIAKALKIKRQSAQWRLREVESIGTAIVNGQEVAAWPFSSLPQSMRDQLEAEAKRLGFRDANGLLLDPAKPWQPPVPLAQISPRCLDKAAKLRDAMASALGRMNAQDMPSAEFEALGVKDYERVFGYNVSARHWRDLFKRTIDRDAGAENWGRLEIYLDDHLGRNAEPRPDVGLAAELEFRELHDVIALVANSQEPTATEVSYLWLRAFQAFEARIRDGKPSKVVKCHVLAFLQRHAPFMATTADALRCNFKRKYKRWIAADRQVKSLQDARKEKSGHRRALVLSDQDRDKLIGHGVFNCGGRVSQAWRELCQSNSLSEEILEHHLSNPASKSYVPKRIREAVKHEVALLDDIHHGPRQHQLNGAHLDRDWSFVSSGDWYQADDATLPVYYYEPDGKGWFQLMRGQCLLFIDLRSTFILGFALQSERSYNARVIRATITRVCDKYGLPRKGFYFEGGVWKDSRILKGNPEADEVSWIEAETGLREFGLRFVHARLARSKPVERVIGAIQDLMEGDLGYVGRNEMVEKFERVQRVKLDVERHKVHPSEHFLSADLWTERLEEICATYNTAKNDGKMTGGLTPEEAFTEFNNSQDPQIRLDANCRYLLAHHKRPVLVTKNGITLRFGKQVYNYRSSETAPLVGQTILAWFDPENSEVLAVTDMNRKHPFTLERSQSVPAMIDLEDEAGQEIMAQEMRRIEDHQAYAKVRYRTLSTQFARPFRQNLVDRKTVELGQEMSRQKQELQTKQRQSTVRLDTVHRKAKELGIPQAILNNRSSEANEGLDLMRRAKLSNQEGQPSSAQESEP